MSFDIAPIALFVYNRPFHTEQTIDSLLHNEISQYSNIYIFADGPKSDRDSENVSAVRNYINNIRGFRSVNIIEKQQNLGLANSIIAGVAEIVNTYGKVIVLEDDMVVSPYFLRYMNDALIYYKDVEQVGCIHGYTYPLSIDLPETFFLRGADCWGWATWKRGWDLFEADGQKLLDELRERNLLKKFDVNGSYPYVKMLSNQIQGKINSWAIRWHASLFLKDKLTLFPGVSLLHNIGIDGSGTHCKESDVFEVPISQRPIKVSPIPVQENTEIVKALEIFYRQRYGSGIGRVRRVKKALLSRSRTLLLEYGSRFKDKVPSFVKEFAREKLIDGSYGYFGTYRQWADATRDSEGYDAVNILEKVKSSLLKVKNGQAVYERDSVLFNRVQYAWPLLAGLMWVAAQRGGSLDVLDFGGSLGSTYFQNKQFLDSLDEVRWSIVEQNNFVECGKVHFSDEALRFFHSVDECLAERQPTVLLLSSVLQYLEKPYEFLEGLLNFNFEFVIIDRTTFVEGDNDQLTVQRVPPTIYPASYPAWFLGYKKFLDLMMNHYEIVAEFDALGGAINIHGGQVGYDKGFIAKLQKPAERIRS